METPRRSQFPPKHPVPLLTHLYADRPIVVNIKIQGLDKAADGFRARVVHIVLWVSNGGESKQVEMAPFDSTRLSFGRAFGSSASVL